MNGLYFPSHLKIINLTPYKISICRIIITILKNEKLNRIALSNLKLFDVLKQLINEYKCEISKNLFYQKLKEVTKNIFQNEAYSNKSDQVSEVLIEEIETFYNKIKSINDIYTFFNIDIHDLKIRNEEGFILLENGGWVDNFVRKCLFAFYKLSFEDINKLYVNLRNYINGDELIIQLTSRESEILFEKQIIEFDQGKLTKNEEKYLKHFNYRHKYFFLAKNENMKLGSLDNIHKFFDYNMKYFYNDASQNETKIHYLLLNMVEFYFNNSFYEQAIQGKIV
jgi:hypothetical protein